MHVQMLRVCVCICEFSMCVHVWMQYVCAHGCAGVVSVCARVHVGMQYVRACA